MFTVNQQTKTENCNICGCGIGEHFEGDDFVAPHCLKCGKNCSAELEKQF